MTNMSSTRARTPSAAWYGLSVLILVAGWLAMAILLVTRIGGTADRMMRLVVPGEAELRLTQTGTYTIFHEYRSTLDGRVYDTPSVDGLDVTVRALPSGRLIELMRGGDSSYSLGGSAGRSLFDFEVSEPGAYRIAGAYADGRREPQAVLAVDRGFVGDLLITILVAIACAFGGTGGAIVVAILVARRRAKAVGAPI
jgi:hypothetical protein